MASSSVAWMPSHGRHQINIGPSLGRAIKARKLKGSPATTKRSNLPERDFYAFRYNFKPGAIDSTRPASIEVKKNLDNNTQINAEFPSKDMTEVCTYNGTEIPAKEVECIIVYDEETGQYTLEKLDSVVSLQFGGKRQATVTTTSSPPVTEPSASSTPLANNTKGKAKRKADEQDELEQLLLQAGDDTIPQRQEEEEEEEGEEVDIPLRIQVSKRAAAPSMTTTTKPTNNTSQLPHTSSIMTTTKSSAAAGHATSKPAKLPKSASKQTKKPKAAPLPQQQPAAPVAAVAEEIIEIERPAKKPRISSTTTSTSTITPRASQPTEPPKPLAQIYLPGGQSNFVAPPAPAALIPSKNLKATNTNTNTNNNNTTLDIPMTVPPGVSANITMEEVLGDDEVLVPEGGGEEEEEEEEEEDWEAVPTTSAPSQQQQQQPDEYDILEDEIFGHGFEEEEQEIDVNAFEQELNEQMEMVEEEEEEDDDMEDVMQEAASGDGVSRPISLNRLASGIAVGESEEDYSSSESESD